MQHLTIGIELQYLVVGIMSAEIMNFTGNNDCFKKRNAHLRSWSKETLCSMCNLGPLPLNKGVPSHQAQHMVSRL